MRARRFVLPDDHVGLRDGLAAVRATFDVPEGFPADVARAAEGARPDLAGHRDATRLPLVTIDPPGSRDLDQALMVETLPGGRHRVWYAIADVGAFVPIGSPLDLEARRRGVTLYLPDGRAPLYPRSLSEGSASLLPGKDRPAVLWRIDLDSGGALVDVVLERAVVRSRAQLTYRDAQQAIDRGDDEVIGPLAVVGRLRAEREWVRGGISLPLADQELARTDDGGYELRYRTKLPVEDHNAQVSLLTGFAAARLQLEAGVGVLRTLPPPDDDALDQLRRHAAALHVPWPPEVGYPDWLRTLDPTAPRHQALVSLATRTLRGAGYAAFDGAPPSQPLHGALNMPYAHVTAPLRRLVDRYANEVLLAATSGRRVPADVRALLPQLPDLMTSARRRAGAVDRAVVDLGEALLLAGIGTDVVLSGTVTHVDDRGARVQLLEPAVVARVADAGLSLGEVVALRVAHVDARHRTVRLSVRRSVGGPLLATTGGEA